MQTYIIDLKENSDKLLNKRDTLLSLWQMLAENFYPERADFTVCRYLGEEFADNLTTSYPIIARRELGDLVNSGMRPRNQYWFKAYARNRDDLGMEAKQWLERSTMIMRRALYDKDSQFVRATKEGDQDYVTFGQCVISVEMNRKKNALMFRNWHLRDVAWMEDYDGSICEVHRKSKPAVSKVNSEFKGNLSKAAKELLKKDPNATLEYRHVVMPTERFTGDTKYPTPYVSIYFEADSGHVLREEGVSTQIYVIPRWQTVSGSQYAYSPATVAATPDARLIQAMTLSILEAGEMATNPPMFARSEVFRGDIQRMAQGISFLDLQAEERVADAIEFQPVDSRGLAVAMNMREEIKNMIARAFYLDKLNLPQPTSAEMTAYEVSQRVQEYIRQAVPLFEPMEQDYNAPLLDITYQTLLNNGAFGPDSEIPDELRGSDIDFQFESPLYEAIEKQKANILTQGVALGSQIEALEPGSMEVIKMKEAFNDALEGMGMSAKWRRSEEEIAEREAAKAKQQKMQQVVQMAQQGGEAAAAVGEGAMALRQGGVI